MDSSTAASSTTGNSPPALGLEAGAEQEPQPAEPTAAELRARRDAELRELAEQTPPTPAAAHLERDRDAIAEQLAELAEQAGPPSEEQTLELMERIEALADAEGSAYAEAAAELAGELAELAQREPAKTAEELEQAALLAELDKARDQYERKVRKIVGPEVALPECQACAGKGFDLSGGASGEQLCEHTDYQRCEACAGFGHVLTGSRVEGCDTAPCPGCGGRGYLKRIERPPANGDGELEHGRPAEYGLEPWMGDPAISSG